MITEVTISNYKSLGDGVRLPLGAITALVGANGSGKSNVADVFRFVAESLTVGLEAAIAGRHGINAVRRWSSGRPNNVSIQIQLHEKTFQGSYAFTLAGSSVEDYRVKAEEAVILRSDTSTDKFQLTEGEWKAGPSDLRPKVTKQSLALPLMAGDERFAPLAGALKNVCVYSVFPDMLREPQKPDTVKPMKQHGENWATTLQGLTSNGGAGELKAGLAKLTGDMRNFRVRQIGGYLNAEFLHETPRRRVKDRQKWFECAQESDGTLRVAGIITALVQEPPLTLIGIEEPELTVHVGAIPLLYDFLKQASRREQVLLTTHSIELLELLDVDDIRVVERRSGVTAVSRVRQDQRDSVKQRLMTVGEIISMEGGLQAELPLLESPEKTEN
jgi:predicted ATPase